MCYSSRFNDFHRPCVVTGQTLMRPKAHTIAWPKVHGACGQSDLPTGLTADMFNCYVSVGADVQTSADSSDRELLASVTVTTAQSVGDQANDEERPSDDNAMNDDA